VSQDLTIADVEDPDKDITFPASVVSMFRGELGQPQGGWPAMLQKKILKGQSAFNVRPGSLLQPADLDAEKQQAENIIGRDVTETEFASYLMYPEIFTEFAIAYDNYGPVSTLPTPVYFYGLEPEKDIVIEIEKGKSLVVRRLAASDMDEQGMVTVFFELNGQPRHVRVADRTQVTRLNLRKKAENGNANHIGAPMPGIVSGIFIKDGDKVKTGDVLVSVEAMKMETTLHAEKDATVAQVFVSHSDQVDTKDLLIRLE